MSTCDEIRGLSSICKYSQAMWTVRSMEKRFVSVQISDSCIFTYQTVRQLHFHMSVVLVFLCFCCAKDKTWCNAILVSGIRHGATELSMSVVSVNATCFCWSHFIIGLHWACHGKELLLWQSGRRMDDTSQTPCWLHPHCLPQNWSCCPINQCPLLRVSSLNKSWSGCGWPVSSGFMSYRSAPWNMKTFVFPVGHSGWRLSFPGRLPPSHMFTFIFFTWACGLLLLPFM